MDYIPMSLCQALFLLFDDLPSSVQTTLVCKHSSFHFLARPFILWLKDGMVVLRNPTQFCNRVDAVVEVKVGL